MRTIKKRFQILYHLVRADFLERTRRYSFLITLGVMVYVGYLVVPSLESGALTVDLGNLRGIYNSAWIGSMVAMVSSMVLSLPGFYLVKNAITRDQETRVGQIIAGTPISKVMYISGKTLSNFIFLALIIAVVALSAGGMQLIRGESLHLQPWKLLAPFLFTTLPTLLIAGAAAVLFESISFLRGGFGNTAYFALWIVVVVVSMSGVTFSSRGVIEDPINDLFGVSVIASSMHQTAHEVYPDRNMDLGIGYTVVEGSIDTFEWEGVTWTREILLGRLLWAGLGLGMGLLAAVFFDRFDPARGRTVSSRSPGWLARKIDAARSFPMESLDLSRLIPFSPSAAPPFFRVMTAELRLMLKGLAWWWYAAAFGLVIAGAVNGGDPRAQQGLLCAAWIWPVLAWSGLGVREKIHHTESIVFSAPRPLIRQLPAAWAAGVLVTMLTGSGVAFSFLRDGNTSALTAWTGAALFIPTLALSLGIWSGNRKMFEALYVALWYMGPVNGLPELDFMGLSPAAVQMGMPRVYLVLTALLLSLAFLGRWKQVN